MNIFTMTCNIGIPIIMIGIGVLYRHNSYKNINKVLDLIIPIAMLFSGFSDDKKNDFPKNTNTLISANKKCSLIWIGSGLCTLFFGIIALMVNKSDINNTSMLLLEVECLILVAIFVTVEYFLKRKFYQEVDEKS